MSDLTKVTKEVRESRSRAFVVETGLRDRLETAMEVLQQVERRLEGSAAGFEGGGEVLPEDSERIEEAWQGVYEVFRGMRREIGKTSKEV